MVEGATCIEEALDTGTRVELLFIDPAGGERVQHITKLAKRRRVPVLEVTAAVMKKLSDTSTPQGMVAVARHRDIRADQMVHKAFDFGVALAGVRDPGNAGTILRTALAGGVDAVFLGATSADLYNPKLVRATAGAMFHLPVARDVRLPWLLDICRDLGVQRVAADGEGKVPYDQVDLRRPTLLIFGNEASGMEQEVLSRVDVTARIPLREQTESLNVAIAAAIMIFEVVRQRQDR